MNYTTCLELMKECEAMNNATTICSFNMAGCMDMTTGITNYWPFVIVIIIILMVVYAEVWSKWY